MTIPHAVNRSLYSMFMLAHFKPFSIDCPLIAHGTDSWEYAFHSFTFNDRSTEIMKNWEAIHECQDERDAERLKCQAALTRESHVMTKTLLPVLDDDDLSLDFQKETSEKDFKLQLELNHYEKTGWLTNTNLHVIPTCATEIFTWNPIEEYVYPTASNLKCWSAHVKLQEMNISNLRRNLHQLQSQSSSTIASIESNTTNMYHSETSGILRSCEVPGSIGNNNAENVYHVMDSIGKEFNINEQQSVAYCIAAQTFLSLLSNCHNAQDHHTMQPLRMLMTGPGGTGKTHVVHALNKLMTAYGSAHTIRYLPPTGSAAALIDGTTIHRGLGISIVCKWRGKGN
jgi:hypothetical protein